MKTIVLLAQLRSMDVQLWLEEDRLRFDAPEGVLTANWRAELVAHKAEIIAFLRDSAAATRVVPPPLLPVARTGALPLAFAQQRLWFLAQLDPHSPAYSIPAAVRLIGRLRLPLLQHCIQSIVQRHETLRTSFALQDSQPVQLIAPQVALALPLVDLSALPPASHASIVEQCTRAAARQPFDLARAPLLRVALLRLAPNDHVLLIVVHHIVADGWSVGVFIRELGARYHAGVHHQPPDLPALPIQYADFAIWQRQWLQGDVLDQQRVYWQRQLAGVPALALPSDRPRPLIQSFRGATATFQLPAALVQALTALSQRHGATLFMTLLATFQVLLARYSSQTDLTVGTPIANRNEVATEGLIGCFVNTLVLRADLAGNPGFAALLDRTRATCLDAYAHQDVPFDQVVDALQPDRDLSRTPLFQVFFALQSAPTPGAELPDLRLEPLEIDSATAKFDLSLFALEQPHGLRLDLEYATDLFDAPTITRLFSHLQTLSAAIADAPAQAIADLPLLNSAERQQILGWNATSVAYPSDIPVQQLFAAQAARTPDAVAVVFETIDDGQWTNEESDLTSFVLRPSSFVVYLTYAELDRRANQLAHYLRALDVRPDSCVGIHMPRSPELLIALLGVLKAGGAYLPLDPAYPAERLSFMQEDAQIAVLLTTTKGEGRGMQDDGTDASFVVHRSSFVNRQVVDLAAGWPAIARQPAHAPDVPLSPDNLAYVIYTSGSTGRPKGVQIPHGALLNFLHAMRRQPGIAAHDTLLAVTSLSFDIAGLELWLPLIVGARLVLADRATSADGAALRRLLERSAATIMQATPATWQLLLAAGWPGNEHVRLLCGGEALPRSLADQLLVRSAALWNMYGPTETTIWSTSARVRATTDSSLIGRPIANTQIYVLDARLQPVPINLIGDLYIGGAGLSRGYFNRPDLTAERFVPNPFGDCRLQIADCRLDQSTIGYRLSTIGYRLYKTGDLARYRPNGDLEFFGRSDQQVKLRGFRIELGEIEACLEQHPAIRACVVLAHAGSSGEQRLVAYVVPTKDDGRRTKDEEPDPSIVRRPSSVATELRAFLAERLPEYMIPTAFVLLDALPLTPNGKLDRRALPAPDRMQALADAPFVAARTPIEELLIGIWADVLRLERCGVFDNFFALGGHSLLATQVMSRVQAVFQLDIPVRALFEAPTVVALAERIAHAQQTQSGDQPPPLVPVVRTGALPLAFAQQRLWFLAQLDPHSPAYIIPAAVRLAGQLRLSLLQRCLQRIVQRHETLRTSFAIHDGQPVQLIAPQVDLALPLLDLCALPADARSRVAASLTRAAARQPFDLARAPLLRVTLLRLAPDNHNLLLVVHHIVADGWSVGVFIHELGARYRAGVHAQPPDLPALPIQYADFAIWQRQWLQGALLDAQIAYWQRQLAGVPALALPSDRPRPLIQSLRGATLPFRLPAALVQALTALSQRHGATLFMTLLSAWQLLLARYSAQTDLAVGTPIAGRTQVATEGLIGCFVNTLVLRADLAATPSFAALLDRTRATCLDAYAHQDAPFDQVVDALQPDRDLSRTPLFQVFFALQNLDAPALDLPDLRLEPLDIDSATAKFDISLYMQETNIGPIGAVEYATDLFDPPTIKRLLGHFQILLAGIAAHPERLIADLPLLSDHERHQLLVAWNATAAAYPHAPCMHQLVAAQAARTPDRIAVVFAEQQISYAELDQRANRLATQLRARGVGPEVCAGICLGRTLELVIGMLAVLQAGGAYVPLDPAYPAERLAFMLADSRAAVVLAERRTPVALPHSSTIYIDDPLPMPESASPPPAPVGPQNLAYVIYTSGSTGLPKGVAISHRSAVALLQWARTVFESAQRVLASTSICFDLSVFELFVPLSWGSSVILAENVLQLPSLPAADTVGLINTVPSALAELLHAGAVPSSVHTVNLAGEPLAQRLVQQLYEHPSIQQVFNLYGPSEDTTYSTYTLIARGCSDQPSIGRPIANSQAYVLDDKLRPVVIGAVGELYLGGAGLARGYLNRPDLTAERFVPNPFGDCRLQIADYRLDQSTRDYRLSAIGYRLYKTGDRACYRPDGAIMFLGRIDQQVKLRGFRIELSEIQTRLNRHPAVHASVVLAREDTPGNQRLVAYVVPDLPHLDQQALQPEWNAEQLTHWQAIWDAAYAQATPVPDPTFDTRGWISSYTGLPIPDEEMQTLVAHTVERIRALRPRAVLEIGCGSGLLLFRLAPECQRYLGTDISQKALHDLRCRLAQDGAAFAQVDLLQRPAADYDGIAPGSVDTLIMNSVTQYFPHITYLVQVLEGALRVVSPGGHIFVGDVRSLPLLETFHSAVQLRHAQGQQSLTELRRRIRASIAQERELVIDPAFFMALQQHFPQISHVDIQLKRGRQYNELTQFRYDVTLVVGDAAAPAPLPHWLDWQQAELTLPALGLLLRQTSPDALRVAGVPNARLAELRTIVERIAQPNGLETVDDLRSDLRTHPGPPGIDPEDFWQIAAELPYSVAISWSAAEQDGRYDVVFTRHTAPAPSLNMRRPADAHVRQPWTNYANNPLREQLLHTLESQLRTSLQQQLPEYMIPSAWVLLDALPLTPNGKLDRQALPAPNTSRSPLKGSFVEPGDPLELHIARIWEELLKVYPIGSADNFFELGGHSLLAVRLMTQIRERFGQDLPLSTLFQEPTVAQLAQAIRRQRPALFQPPLVALQPAGTRRPFFCVHALWGSAMPYIDLARQLGTDQPMYGLQSLGIEGDEAMPDRIEDMAARYIAAIQAVQPYGPYLLGGWSMGGIVAFEMARQLLQRGEGVGLLAIIDSTAPLDGAYQRVALDDAALLTEFIHDLPSQFRHELTTVDQALLDAWLTTPAHTPADQLRAIIEQTQRHGLIPEDVEPTRIIRLFHVFAHNLRALASYVPGPYSQRISVFRARQRTQPDDDSPTLGWSQLGPAGVQAIPGDHSTLIAPPHVAVLAAQLRDQIDAAH
jgi:amino acid adenylation domain-containing protein